jgi:uncharacterized FlaG/YvyC family protein
VIIEPIKSIPDLEQPAAPSGRPVKREVRQPAPSSGSDAQPAKVSEETRAQIESMVKELAASKQLNMYYDEDIDRVVVTIVKEANHEVIRQIPSSEFLSFARRFDEFVGLMVDRRV